MLRSLTERLTATLRVAAVLTAAALPLTALPLAAAAQPAAPSDAPTELHYNTEITIQYGRPFPIPGHLDLLFYPDGVLRGFYHNERQQAIIPIIGGHDGTYLWFDLQPSDRDLGLGFAPGARFHVVATMGVDGGFRGQLFPLLRGDYEEAGVSSTSPAVNAPTNHLNPLPQPEPTIDEQFFFAAEPADKSSENVPFKNPQ
jgi:hypothetical protein